VKKLRNEGGNKKVLSEDTNKRKTLGKSRGGRERGKYGKQVGKPAEAPKTGRQNKEEKGMETTGQPTLKRGGNEVKKTPGLIAVVNDHSKQKKKEKDRKRTIQRGATKKDWKEGQANG